MKVFAANNGNAIEVYEFTTLTADFTSDVIEGFGATYVNFTDQSVGSPDQWLWNFGDGNTSTEQNPTHLYTAPGIYTVKLTVTVSPSTTSVEEKVDYITINVIDTDTEYSYISVDPTLKTYDIAPPEDREDLRTMVAEGDYEALLSEDSIRLVIRADTVNPDPAGFKRAQGPSIIFD